MQRRKWTGVSAINGLDLAAIIFLVGLLLWGAWKGSRSPLLGLVSLFCGSLAAYMLYPVTAATLADTAGLPVLPSCVIAACGLFVIVAGGTRLFFGQIVKKANVKAQEREEEPEGDETFWDQTTKILADRPDAKDMGLLTRALGSVFAVLIGGWLLGAVGLVATMLDPPFPASRNKAADSRVSNLFEESVQPALNQAPHLALAGRIALLARAANEIHRAGPQAVHAASAHPDIQALFREPAIAAALDDPSLVSLIDAGDLGAALRHPRMSELLRRPDARAAIVKADLAPVLAASEQIVAGKRDVAQAPDEPTTPDEPDEPTTPGTPTDSTEPDNPEPDLIPTLPPPRPVSYAHGHQDHECKEGCPKFSPPHGHRLHACDAACSEFVAPHGHHRHRCDAACPQFQAPHGHRLHDCGERCPNFVPPHGHRLHACDSACPEFKAQHGHHRHRCAPGCSKYSAPHGHRLHDCGERCPNFVPPHGHRLHACDSACPKFKAVHGHRLHKCSESCASFVPPHGHKLHQCVQGCALFVPPHGHRLHGCSTSCSKYRAPDGHKVH